MRGIRTRVTAVALTGAVAALAVAPGIAAAKPTGGPNGQSIGATLGALLKQNPRLVDLVALNPQPLPPGPDEAKLVDVRLPDLQLEVGP